MRLSRHSHECLVTHSRMRPFPLASRNSQWSDRVMAVWLGRQRTGWPCCGVDGVRRGDPTELGGHGPSFGRCTKVNWGHDAPTSSCIGLHSRHWAPPALESRPSHPAGHPLCPVSQRAQPRDGVPNSKRSFHDDPGAGSTDRCRSRAAGSTHTATRRSQFRSARLIRQRRNSVCRGLIGMGREA